MMANSKDQQGHKLRSILENTNAPEITQVEGDAPPAPPEQLLNHTILKFLTASFSFFVAGVNDGSVGALIPYVIRQYNINTAQTSALYVKSQICLESRFKLTTWQDTPPTLRGGSSPP
jgi:fucose permease